MMGDKKGKGMGLLIGIGPKPKGDYEPDELAEEEDGASREAKVAAAEAIIAAVKGGDASALVDAMDALEAC